MNRREFYYEVTRDVSTDECWWLSKPLKIGEKLYLYEGRTYGAISDGLAMTREAGMEPFFEVPRDAITRLSEQTKEVTDE